MTDRPRWFQTTAIDYPNSRPHIGTAFEKVGADVQARYRRMEGFDVRFLMGNDENTVKVSKRAAELGVDPQAYCDDMARQFREVWDALDISYDVFIQTSHERHKAACQKFIQKVYDNGHIYKGAYEGWYCVACEAYYGEGDLLAGRQCPVHKREVSWLSEPTYFFRMSRYGDRLLEHFEQNPAFVQPEGYKNEVVSFVKSGLRDLSVSRTTFKWGIPVPGDEEHVIYVWIDALTNYMSALGPIGGDLHRRYWPATCHLIGKDILKFHAVYWPCMLLSAGLPLPGTVFTHGWWTVRGEKISKSMPATRVDPNQLGEDIGVDALRYYILREVPLGLDGDFTYESLIGRYNAELANDLGNLVSRALTVAAKFCAGAVPPVHAALSTEGRHAEIAQIAREVIGEVEACYRAYAPSRALEGIWRLVREANRYVNDTQPWVVAKDPARRHELDHSVRTALEALCCAARMAAPVMPKTAEQILALVGMPGARGQEAIKRWPVADRFGQELELGAPLGASTILFPRIDEARQAALLEQWIPKDARAEEAAAGARPAPAVSVSAGSPSGDGGAQVTFEEFGKLDLRVAKVLTAEAVPKANKLLKLTVDVGEEQPRQVVAGIAEAFRPEELVGRSVIFLANLKPATIRGVTSQGMILAAGADAVLGLSAVDRDLPPGTKIR